MNYGAIATALTVLMLVMLVGALVVVLWRAWRQHRRTTPGKGVVR